MSFEIRDRDLLARIGKLETKSGTVETPLLLPVINPTIQPISPKNILQKFNHPAIITNAYIIKKRFENKPITKGIHSFLDFDGVIMTDSGAYQTLMYGRIEFTPEESVKYQEEIDTDIATILDVPTGWDVSKRYAKYTVDETLKRAKKLPNIKSCKDILWVGPVQGGQHLDLVDYSATEMGNLPFQIYALGSPTPVMEQYLFDTLVDMILTAKTKLPPEKPLHLFGAGHPFMFALAIALGCDLFDSAAYAIYAREDRYLTEYGTLRLDEMEYFPCACPVCTRRDPEEVRSMEKAERQKILAEHNLFASLSEVNRVKQAIVEGRLWEHLELRAHGHPALLQGVKNLHKYREYLEKHSPATKKAGLFFYSSLGLLRPEVTSHRKKLMERCSPPKEAKVLLLLPQTRMKPFHRSVEHRRALKEIVKHVGTAVEKVHTCTYAAPFGVVPRELDQVYPLSQHEITVPLDTDLVEDVAEQVARYVATTNYESVILLQDRKMWRKKITEACQVACRRKSTPFHVVRAETLWGKNQLHDLAMTVKRALG